MKKWYVALASLFFLAFSANLLFSAENGEEAAETQKPRVLFLCTGNSCRSQMAEGWAKTLIGDRFDIYSAGITPHGLNPNAVKVMGEAGVDITEQKSEDIADFKDFPLDVIITVCPNAHEAYPDYLNKFKVIHHPFPDPPKVAKEIAEKGGSEEEQLECCRTVRDAIKAYVETLP